LNGPAGKVYVRAMSTLDATLPDAPDRPKPKPGILDIQPYVGGKSKIDGVAHPIKLSSNENILGCSPLAQAAFAETAHQMNLYPDGRCETLRAAIAEKHGLEPDRLIFGCGSDEVFTMLAQVYCEAGDNVVQGQYGFLAYRIAARSAGAQVRFAKEANLRVDVEAVLAEVDDRTRIVYIADPANPTGTWLTGAEIRALHQGLPPNVILVLDGAYAEFAEDAGYDDGVALARRSNNIVVTRTFSKIYGLAALRIGWGYAPLAVIDALERIRGPFNVNLPAQAAALAALQDEDFVEQSRALVRTWRPWLTQQLGGLGLEVFPSQANFVLARFPKTPGKTAAEGEAFLASKGLLVRGTAGYGLGDCLRITIGLEAHNRAVVEALGAFLRR
jgi:histidinol-phosphate aminotransferase